MNRRSFLKIAGISGIGFLEGCRLGGCGTDNQGRDINDIRFGVCADVHMSYMYDARERMQIFVDRMNSENVDFVIQLGDFCTPYYRRGEVERIDEHVEFMAIWNQFSGPRYHVLGNHDVDHGCTWEETMAFWGMDKTYYSFDKNGWHFVVLDGNNQKENEKPVRYPRYIGITQRVWLKEDLANTDLPTIVFSHQSLECNNNGVENNAEIRGILEDANSKAGHRKVVACFSGHHHIDYHVEINNIHYIQINSMGYQWLGKEYEHKRLSDELDVAYPLVKYISTYKDALYAIVKLSPNGVLEIEGIKSEYVSPTPKELGVPEAKEGERGSPQISDRQLNWF